MIGDRQIEDTKMWYMPMYSGRRVNFTKLGEDLSQIDIRDIARGLAGQRRYAGQLDVSTAEHCVVMADCIPANYIADQLKATADKCTMSDDPMQLKRNYSPTMVRLVTLMHDAEECYLQDLPRPVKRHPAMHWYRKQSEYVRRCIWERYELPMFGAKCYPAQVAHADDQILHFEALSSGYKLHPDCQSPVDVTFDWDPAIKVHKFGMLDRAYWEMMFIRRWATWRQELGYAE